MKKIFATAFVLTLFSSSAWGIMINEGSFNGTNVGSVDTFIDSTNSLGNSNPTTETNWVNSVLNPDVTYLIKTEPVEYYSTDTANTYAFELAGTGVGYFLVKNATYWALFQNLADLDWGVFDTGFLPTGMNLPSEDFQISHVTEFNGGSNEIPEPATMLLFGTGLAGLAAAGRRRKKEA